MLAKPLYKWSVEYYPITKVWAPSYPFQQNLYSVNGHQYNGFELLRVDPGSLVRDVTMPDSVQQEVRQVRDQSIMKQINSYTKFFNPPVKKVSTVTPPPLPPAPPPEIKRTDSLYTQMKKISEGAKVIDTSSGRKSGRQVKVPVKYGSYYAH